MRSAFAICLLTRLALVVVAWAGLVLVPLQPVESQWRGFPENLWIDGWCRWDSGWYAPLAQSGYQNQPNSGGERDTNFFPFYPLLMRVAAPLFDGCYMSAGLLVSNLAFLVGGLAVYAWGRARVGPQAARRGLVLLCVFPFSVYFGAVYSEALFLACAALAFLYAERENWLLAALFASCAGITRIPGFLVGLGVVILYLEKHGRPRSSFIYLAIIPALPLAHLALLWRRFGEPLAFISSNRAWDGPRLSDVLTRLGTYDSFHVAVYSVQLALFLAALVTCGLVFRRLGAAYGLWCLLHLLISLKPPFLSIGRYMCVLFPLFVVLGQSLPRWLFWTWSLLSAVLLGVVTWCFTHWLPVP